jgi:high-affinity iron transporter
MLATLIVVLREVLEASLVVSIIMAATRGVPLRGRWIAGGCAAGVLGAVLVALFAGEISSLMQGFGQELFNATVLFAAVAMLAWHNIWMSRHGRELAREVGQVGRDVVAGSRPMYALAIVCAMALLREGSEVVLFLNGIVLAGDVTTIDMIEGGGLGVLAGAALGCGLYLGLLSIPPGRLFGATSMLILLLAAGLASQGAAFLAAANVLPALGNSLWDTSSIISEHSMLGQVLHVMAGYTARPAGIQLVFYVATLAVIGTGMRLVRRQPGARPAQAAAAAPGRSL